MASWHDLVLLCWRGWGGLAGAPGVREENVGGAGACPGDLGRGQGRACGRGGASGGLAGPAGGRWGGWGDGKGGMQGRRPMGPRGLVGVSEAAQASGEGPRALFVASGLRRAGWDREGRQLSPGAQLAPQEEG